MSGAGLVLDRRNCVLVAVDLQARMTGAIEGAEQLVAEAKRLIAAAGLLQVPVLFTEQNPAKLGPTLAELGARAPLAKMHFDACAEPGFLPAIAPGQTAVLIGCEAHVCVLQTALGLIAHGRRVAVAADAVSSRRGANRQAALDRLARAGADIVTAEMVIFEWLESAGHPRFREVLALVR